jgi:uncharacterized protein
MARFRSFFASGEASFAKIRDSMDRDLQKELHDMCKLPAISEALSRLKLQLPSNLTYHAYDHTVDVLSEVLRLATIDGRMPREREILAIAAAWHDIGFIERPTNNEPVAAQAATAFLSSLGAYSSDEVNLIACMILDTALVPYQGSFKQIPTTHLSPYLLDADLANFGRDDFFSKSELQRNEIGEGQRSFQAKTVALLENHVWLTPAAVSLWQATKARNLAILRANMSV